MRTTDGEESDDEVGFISGLRASEMADPKEADGLRLTREPPRSCSFRALAVTLSLCAAFGLVAGTFQVLRPPEPLETPTGSGAAASRAHLRRLAAKPDSVASARPGTVANSSATRSSNEQELLGHELLSGAVEVARRRNATKRWGPHMRQPYANTNVPVHGWAGGGGPVLCLIGILSHAPNFASRDFQRRALWSQRPWMHGMGWTFLIGRTLP